MLSVVHVPVRYYVNLIADTQDNEEKREEPLPTLTAAEIFFQRQRKLDKMKRKIANLASSIIENPENEVNVTFQEHILRVHTLKLVSDNI